MQKWQEQAWQGGCRPPPRSPQALLLVRASRKGDKAKATLQIQIQRGDGSKGGQRRLHGLLDVRRLVLRAVGGRQREISWRVCKNGHEKQWATEEGGRAARSCGHAPR